MDYEKYDKIQLLREALKDFTGPRISRCHSRLTNVWDAFLGPHHSAIFPQRLLRQSQCPSRPEQYGPLWKLLLLMSIFARVPLKIGLKWTGPWFHVDWDGLVWMAPDLGQGVFKSECSCESEARLLLFLSVRLCRARLSDHLASNLTKHTSMLIYSLAPKLSTLEVG